MNFAIFLRNNKPFRRVTNSHSRRKLTIEHLENRRLLAVEPTLVDLDEDAATAITPLAFEDATAPVVVAEDNAVADRVWPYARGSQAELVAILQLRRDMGWPEN